MNNKIKTAFTLVELLVVIAIVGILSGLIIVGMNSSVNSARVAKAQIFSSSLKDSMLMNLVSEWKFDGTGIADGSAATTAYTQDNWSTNNCTIGGGPLVYSGSSCVYNSCLKFNGSTDYLDCGNSSSLDLVSALTIEAWVKRSVIGVNHEVFNKRGWNENASYRTYITASNTLLFGYGNASGYVEPVSTSKINDTNWHHMAITYSSSNISFYIDGILSNSVATQYYPLATNTKDVFIGSYTGGGSVAFNGFIDNIRIYSVVIPSIKIKEKYYADLSRLLAKKEIYLNGYIGKINDLIK